MTDEDPELYYAKATEYDVKASAEANEQLRRSYLYLAQSYRLLADHLIKGDVAAKRPE